MCDYGLGKTYEKYVWQDGCKCVIMNLVRRMRNTPGRTDVNV